MWTKEEEDFLKQNTHLKISEICEKLNKKYTTVQNKLSKLNIKSHGKDTLLSKIMKLDINYIKELIKNCDSYNSLAKKLQYKNTTNFINIINSLQLDVSHFKSNKYNKYIGQVINNLEILNVIQNKHKYFIIRCFCGKEFSTQVYSIINQTTKSCGCSTGKFTSEKNSGKNNKRWIGYEDISGKYWSSIKSGAIKRKLKFDLNIEDVWNLYIKQNKKCSLTGLDISFKKDSRYKASIDRIDSSKGYIINNIQIVYFKVNIMKQDLSDVEFVNLCKLIAKKE